MNISIVRDDIEIGEWTEEEVRDFYREGRLVDTDRYWTEGMTEWTPLSRLIRPAPPFPASTAPDIPIEPPPFSPASQKTKKTDTQKFNIPEDSEGEFEAELAAMPPPFSLPPVPSSSLPPLPSLPVALSPRPTQRKFYKNPIEEVPTEATPTPFPMQAEPIVSPVLETQRNWKQNLLGCLSYGGGMILTLFAMGIGKQLPKSYPDAARLVTYGALLGALAGVLPYCIARFYFQSKHYNRFLQVGAGIGGILGLIYWPTYTNNLLNKMAAEMNSEMPMQIADDLRCDKVAFNKGRVFTAYLTYTDTDHPIDFQSAEAMRPVLRANLIKSYQNPNLKVFRDAGVSMEDDIYDTQGTIILEVRVGPSDTQ